MKILDMKRVRAYRDLGYEIKASTILSDDAQVAFWSLPGIKHWLMSKVDKKVFAERDYVTRAPARLYIPRIKMTRRITHMGLKTSRDWVSKHFGK